MGDCVTRRFIGDGEGGRMLFCNYNSDLVLWKGKKVKLEMGD